MVSRNYKEKSCKEGTVSKKSKKKWFIYRITEIIWMNNFESSWSTTDRDTKAINIKDMLEV